MGGTITSITDGYLCYPRPQGLFGKKWYGGKTGGARDDGSEAQRFANRPLWIP